VHTKSNDGYTATLPCNPSSVKVPGAVLMHISEYTAKQVRVIFAEPEPYENPQ
jgi:hypothetical protein